MLGIKSGTSQIKYNTKSHTLKSISRLSSKFKTLIKQNNSVMNATQRAQKGAQLFAYVAEVENI